MSSNSTLSTAMTNTNRKKSLSDEPLIQSPKKLKKRKRGEPTSVPEQVVQEAAHNEQPEPPKKKRKNRTSFSDPRVDDTLSVQSRKALEYAFLQMNRPSKWKFNKARQNWLIRNVWSPEEVPEIYFSLVVKYLSDVQGGSREKLKESSRAYLKIEEESPQPLVVQRSTAKELVTPVEQPTPGAIIINTPSSQPTSGATIVPPSLPSKSIIILKDIQRTRAQQLLECLETS